MGDERLEQAPDVPDYLLPEVPKPPRKPEPGRLEDDLQTWTKDELVREVRRLREEVARESAAYSDLMWERDNLAQHYTMHRGGGDGWT